MKTALAAAALAALAACSDVCGNGESATQNVANFIANCTNADPGFFGGYSPCFDQNACEENIKSCTQADIDIFQTVANCQNQYANSNACTEDELQTYDACAGAATTLADGGSTLSLKCAAAFAANPGVCGSDAG